MQKYPSGNLGDALLSATDLIYNIPPPHEPSARRGFIKFICLQIFVQVRTMFFKVNPYSSSTLSNKYNLVTGRLSVAPFSRTSTVVTNPSAPGNTFSTRHKAHWFLATWDHQNNVSDVKVSFFLLPLGSLLQSWHVLFKPASPKVIGQ